MKINYIVIFILAFSISNLHSHKVDALEINASTSLEASKNFTYVPKNLIDRNIATAWCSNNKISTSLSISLKYPKPMRLTGIGIINGYARNISSFTNNARPKDLVMKVDAKEPVKISLADTPELQWIEFEPVTGTVVKFEVKTVYAGLKYDDVCVTEVFDDKRIYDGYGMLNEIEKKISSHSLTPNEIQQDFKSFFTLTFNYEGRDEKTFWYAIRLKTTRLDESGLRLLLYLAYYANHFRSSINAELLEGLRDMVIPFIEHDKQLVMKVLNDKTQVMRENIVSAYYMYIDQFGYDPATNEISDKKVRDELRDIDINIKRVEKELKLQKK